MCVHPCEPDARRVREGRRERSSPFAVRVDADDLGMVSEAVEKDADEPACSRRDVEDVPAGEGPQESSRSVHRFAHGRNSSRGVALQAAPRHGRRNTSSTVLSNP